MFFTFDIASFGGHVEEAFLESHVQRSGDAFLLLLFLQVVNGAPTSDAVDIGAGIVVIGVIDAPQTLQITNDFHGVFIDEGIA